MNWSKIETFEGYNVILPSELVHVYLNNYTNQMGIVKQVDLVHLTCFTKNRLNDVVKYPVLAPLILATSGLTFLIPPEEQQYWQKSLRKITLKNDPLKAILIKITSFSLFLPMVLAIELEVRLAIAKKKARESVSKALNDWCKTLDEASRLPSTGLYKWYDSLDKNPQLEILSRLEASSGQQDSTVHPI